MGVPIESDTVRVSTAMTTIPFRVERLLLLGIAILIVIALLPVFSGWSHSRNDDDELRLPTVVVYGYRIPTSSRYRVTPFRRGAVLNRYSRRYGYRNSNGYEYASLESCYRHPKQGYCFKRCLADDTQPFCALMLEKVVVYGETIKNTEQRWSYKMSSALSLVKDRDTYDKWVTLFSDPNFNDDDELVLPTAIAEMKKPERNKCKPRHTSNAWPQGRWRFDWSSWRLKWKPFPVDEANEVVTDTFKKILITGEDGHKLVNWRDEREGAFLVIYNKDTQNVRIGREIFHSSPDEKRRVTIDLDEVYKLPRNEILIGIAHNHFIRVREDGTTDHRLTTSGGDLLTARRIESELREHELEHNISIFQSRKFTHPHLKMWIGGVYEDSAKNLHLMVKGFDVREKSEYLEPIFAEGAPIGPRRLFYNAIQDDIFHSTFINSNGILTDRCPK